jgi:hypothetical protein
MGAPHKKERSVPSWESSNRVLLHDAGGSNTPIVSWRHYGDHRLASLRLHERLPLQQGFASGNHPKSGPFIDSLVEKLKSAAEETIELHGDSVDFVALQFEVAQEVEHLRLWDRHVSAIEREVEQIYQRVHPSNALRATPALARPWLLC